jgi:hypothetical protein
LLHTGMALVGAVHVVAHLPQLEVSLLRLTQEVPHCVLVPQSVVHRPERQTWPVLHTFAQLPQCWESDCISTQAPEHFV